MALLKSDLEASTNPRFSEFSSSLSASEFCFIQSICFFFEAFPSNSSLGVAGRGIQRQNSKTKSSKIHLFPQERIFRGWQLVCVCSKMYAVIYKWACSPTWGDILRWRSQRCIEALTQNTFHRTKWSSQFDIDISSICHAVFCLNLMVKVAGQVWVGEWSMSLQ